MKTHEAALAACLLFAVAAAAVAQASATGSSRERGPYARIAFLKPRDGNTVDFEAGYIRHLEWHRQAKDPFVWYGWTVSAGERQRFLVYATFGHSAASFDDAVSPAEDERDNVANVMPHSEFAGGGFYEFVPALSHGSETGVPEPESRAELTTVEPVPGSADAFEKALRAATPSLRGETLWYRMIAGGLSPRYVRLRPRATIAALLEAPGESALPAEAARLAARITVEILSLRPALSYGLPAAE